VALDIWPGADGRFDLYEDEGRGFGYLAGAYRWTTITTSTSSQGCVELQIAPALGDFPGAPMQRSWTVRFHGPAGIQVVTLDAQPIGVPTRIANAAC
jgi:alpha-D-xyloside xylohydrolase